MAGAKEKINEFKLARIDLVDEIDKVRGLDNVVVISLINSLF